MTATAAEPSVALVLVVNVQTLREKIFSIEMPHLVTAISLSGNALAQVQRLHELVDLWNITF